MQEIILDYVHDDKLKFVSLMANTFFCLRRGARLPSSPFSSFRSESSNGGQRAKCQRRARGQRPAPIRSRITATTWWCRRRRLGPARRRRLQRSGLAHRLHHQGLPDPLAHGGGARRHRRRARQHGRGRLALAHVRHRQGLRLARRPGRHRISLPQRAGSRLRARALGPAVLAPRGRRQDLSAPVRRHDHALRQGHRAAHLRRRRPHRPRHAAHDVRPGAQAFRRILHRIFRHRPDHGRRRPLPRRGRAQYRRRHHPSFQRQHDHPRDRRLWAHLFLLHLGAYLHRATGMRWCCARACRCRTWNSCSSIRPASTAPAA